MGLISNLLNVERRFAWSFVGALLGFISLIIAFSLYYLGKQEQKIDLRITVEDEVNLVEIKERIPLLKILYANQDIIESGKEIKLIRLNVMNSGQTILQTFFDMNQEFGLTFENSSILGVSIIDSNSSYLRENILKVKNTTVIYEKNQSSAVLSDKLDFQKVIFEKGKYIRFKIVLIQDKGIQKTTITPIGKISGMDSIPVSHIGLENNKTNHSKILIPIIIGGGILAYFLIVGSMLLLIIVLDKLRTRKRRKAVDNFIVENHTLTEDQHKILQSYKDGWPDTYLRLIKAIIKGRDALDLSEYVRNEVKLFIVRPENRIAGLLSNSIGKRIVDRMAAISLMPEIFSRDGSRVSLNLNNRDVILRFLKSANKIKTENQISA